MGEKVIAGEAQSIVCLYLERKQIGPFQQTKTKRKKKKKNKKWGVILSLRPENPSPFWPVWGSDGSTAYSKLAIHLCKDSNQEDKTKSLSEIIGDLCVLSVYKSFPVDWKIFPKVRKSLVYQNTESSWPTLRAQ